MGTSTFAEYPAAPDRSPSRSPGDASPPLRRFLFACVLSTGLGAAMYTAKVQAGATVSCRRRYGRLGAFAAAA